jgi:hypothetical protein
MPRRFHVRVLRKAMPSRRISGLLAERVPMRAEIRPSFVRSLTFSLTLLP